MRINMVMYSRVQNKVASEEFRHIRPKKNWNILGIQT